MKKVKKEGKGNKGNAAQPIEQHEIEKLYNEGQLGNGSPQAIINTLWFRFTTNFGMRSVEEHYNLRWGDVKLCCDTEGDEYLELVERQTKTRTGATDESRTVPPRIWASDDPSKCVVATYRLYASKRPHGLSNENDPFYLSTCTQSNTDRWFISMRMGSKKIAQIMKTMCTKAGISRKLTNHSARKHMVQKLRDSGCCPTDIMQLSGHKNVQSIINYSNISLKTQKKCSNILTGNTNNDKSVLSSSQLPNFTTGTNEFRMPTPVQSSNTSGNSTKHTQQTGSLINLNPAVPFPTHFGTPRGGLFFGATVNISNFNVYCSDANVEK